MASRMVAFGISICSSTASNTAKRSSVTKSGVQARLAPWATMMELFPAALTVISAVPVGRVSLTCSAETSTPAAARFCRRASPKASFPTAPSMETAASIRAAAKAWFAPFPPGEKSRSCPNTVSPTRGISNTRTEASILRLPMTNSRFFIHRSSCPAATRKQSGCNFSYDNTEKGECPVAKGPLMLYNESNE